MISQANAIASRTKKISGRGSVYDSRLNSKQDLMKRDSNGNNLHINKSPIFNHQPHRKMDEKLLAAQEESYPEGYDAIVKYLSDGWIQVEKQFKKNSESCDKFDPIAGGPVYYQDKSSKEYQPFDLDAWYAHQLYEAYMCSS